VVYVDIDPVAVAHARMILADNPLAGVIQADLRQPGEVLAHHELTHLLDLRRPVALLMVAVLHFVPDADDPTTTVADYRDALAGGSYLAISHATEDGQAPRQAAEHRKLYARTPTPMTMRSHDEVAHLLRGWDLVDPGLVRLPLWRPDPADETPESPEAFAGYAAVGRKPEARRRR
jgi:hypothetical protein